MLFANLTIAACVLFAVVWAIVCVRAYLTRDKSIDKLSFSEWVDRDLDRKLDPAELEAKFQKHQAKQRSKQARKAQKATRLP